MLQDGVDLAEWIAKGSSEMVPFSVPQATPALELETRQTPALAVLQEELPPDPPTSMENRMNAHGPNVRSDGTRCLTHIYLSEKHPHYPGLPSWIQFVGWYVCNAYLRGHIDARGS